MRKRKVVIVEANVNGSEVRERRNAGICFKEREKKINYTVINLYYYLL